MLACLDDGPELICFCLIRYQTVARDLWAMYVSLTSLESEPFKEDDDGEGGAGAAQASGSDAKADADRDPMQQIYDELSDTDTASESDPDPDPDAPENPGVERGGAGADGANRHTPDSHARHKRKKKAATPFDPASVLRLQYTLVICYLSCLTLRVPVLMKDLLE